MDVSGTKNLIVIYNKTFKGENASTPIVAQKTFEVVPAITALHIVSAPKRLDYTYYEASGITLPENATLALDVKAWQYKLHIWMARLVTLLLIS